MIYYTFLEVYKNAMISDNFLFIIATLLLIINCIGVWYSCRFMLAIWNTDIENFDKYKYRSIFYSILYIILSVSLRNVLK